MSRARRININSLGKNVSSEPVYALLYIRVSSDRQATEGNGLESQELRCRQYATSSEYIVDRVFSDTASGGGDYNKREGVNELIKYIDQFPHRTFVVIVDDLSRIARDTKAYLALKEALRNRKVELRSPNFRFDDSPEGEYIETITAAGNELHRKINRRQVVQRQKARLDLGYWPFGAHRGYDQKMFPEHGKLCIANKEGHGVMKEAIEGFANGKFIHLVDGCRFLVEKGFWTKQSPEKYIDRYRIILKDVFYAGYIEYPQWEVERRRGKHEGIISLETFDTNQKRLRREGLGNKRARLDISPDFPLRGLTVCGGCKEHLYGGWTIKPNGKRHGYYCCHNKACSYYGKSARKDEVHRKFKILLKKQGLKKELGGLLKLVFDKVWDQEIEELEKKHVLVVSREDELKQNIKKLVELSTKAKSDSARSAYEAQIEENDKELKDIEDSSIRIDQSIPYRTALNKATGFLKSPYKIWESVDHIEKQKLFFFIFPEKLPYNIKDGYRTDEIPSAVRLFEEFATAKPRDVDIAGKTLNRLKDYLSRFWDYYQSSSYLQIILANT